MLTAPEALRGIVGNSKRYIPLFYCDLMLGHAVISDTFQEWKDSRIQEIGKF
jgi:hypothetical protein